MVLIGAALFSMLFGIAKCVNDASRPDASVYEDAVPTEDRRAYDDVRRRGYSDQEAREIAKGARQLCEAGGGTDCR